MMILYIAALFPESKLIPKIVPVNLEEHIFGQHPILSGPSLNFVLKMLKL